MSSPQEHFEELKKNTTELSNEIQQEMESMLKRVESLTNKLEELQKEL